MTERGGAWGIKKKKTVVEKGMPSAGTGMATEFGVTKSPEKKDWAAIPKEKRISLSEGMSSIV